MISPSFVSRNKEESCVAYKINIFRANNLYYDQLNFYVDLFVTSYKKRRTKITFLAVSNNIFMFLEACPIQSGYLCSFNFELLLTQLSRGRAREKFGMVIHTLELTGLRFPASFFVVFALSIRLPITLMRNSRQWANK